MLIQYILLIYILYPFSVETDDSISYSRVETANNTRFNVWGMYSFIVIYLVIYKYML